jgi:hypothetical protein
MGDGYLLVNLLQAWNIGYSKHTTELMFPVDLDEVQNIRH